jgi:putative component of toxin-antitoxin plasmid stabilization module
MAIELRYYQTVAGAQPFVEWLQGLKDQQARARDSRRALPASRLATSGIPSRWATACWS